MMGAATFWSPLPRECREVTNANVPSVLLPQLLDKKQLLEDEKLDLESLIVALEEYITNEEAGRNAYIEDYEKCLNTLIDRLSELQIAEQRYKRQKKKVPKEIVAGIKTLRDGLREGNETRITSIEKFNEDIAKAKESLATSQAELVATNIALTELEPRIEALEEAVRDDLDENLFALLQRTGAFPLRMG